MSDYRLWSQRISSHRHPQRPWVLFCSDVVDDHISTKRVARFSTLNTLMQYARVEFPGQTIQTLPTGASKL
jgi:hypothetical protein